MTPRTAAAATQTSDADASEELENEAGEAGEAHASAEEEQESEEAEESSQPDEEEEEGEEEEAEQEEETEEAGQEQPTQVARMTGAQWRRAFSEALASDADRAAMANQEWQRAFREGGVRTELMTPAEIEQAMTAPWPGRDERQLEDLEKMLRERGELSEARMLELMTLRGRRMTAMASSSSQGDSSDEDGKDTSKGRIWIDGIDSNPPLQR